MGDSYPKFKVAAVQAASFLLDREKTTDKAVHFIEQAADNGAVIIGFPELYLPGDVHLFYLAKKSNPFPNEAAVFTELVKNSVKVPSPTTDRLCKAAKAAHAYVVMGITELDKLYPGTIYISQLVISDGGEIVGVHRKMVTTAVQKLMYSPGDGSHLNVYDTPYGKLSTMICGEHAHDLFKYALVARGTQIHVAAWTSFPPNIFPKNQLDSIDFRVRQFAHAGKIFVINSCSVADEQNINYFCDTKEEKDDIVKNSGGISSIIGPNGQYLAGPLYEGEGVLTAEISLQDALPGKLVQNVLGHYTRWDVLSLNFNQKRLSPFAKEPLPKNTSSGLDLPPELHENDEEVSETTKA